MPASSIPALSHTFMEIDHEIIFMIILLPSADSFKKWFSQLQVKVLVNRLFKLAQEKGWLGELTVRTCMTKAVACDVKEQTSKRHIDRRGAKVNMIKFTVQ